MIEPVIAWGPGDRVALADVLVLPVEDVGVFQRWPGLSMIAVPAHGDSWTIVTRDRQRLIVTGSSIVDILGVVHRWWSLFGQLQ